MSEVNLGLDRSGNNNHFTVNNMTLAVDQVLDSPTNNFCTGNPLDVSGVDNPGDVCTFSEGNTKIVQAGSDNVVGWKASTIGIRTGKWYFEVKLPTIDYQVFGVGDSTWDGQDADQANVFTVYIDAGSETFRKGPGINPTALNVTSANNDIWMFALDLDSPKLWIGHQGTWLASGDPAAGSNPMSTQAITDTLFIGGSLYTQNTSQIILNTGNPPYANSSSQADDNGYGDFEYDVPSGFYSICTANLPEPTVDPRNHFNTVLYTGTGSSNEQNADGITNGVDFLWTKCRSHAKQNILVDIVRGATNNVMSDSPEVENTNANRSISLGNSSFTLNSNSGHLNENNKTYISWLWNAGNANTAFTESGNNPGGIHRANQAAGFSIVSYTGTGAAGTVAHGLGAAPEWILIKNRDVNDEWYVYYGDNTDYLVLDDTDATADNATAFNDTSPTATVFTVNTSHSVNADGEKYIAYCFRSIEGHSKLGQYEGNNNANGTFVNTGFRPSLVVVKDIDSTGEWRLQSSKTNTFNNDDVNVLVWNASTAEYSADRDDLDLDFLSNGFKHRSTYSQVNAARTYVYFAFAETPFKYSNAR
jgi:hypothetical protein